MIYILYFQLNPHVSAFQRRFVGEVRRCEDMEKTFSEWHTYVGEPGVGCLIIGDVLNNWVPIGCIRRQEGLACSGPWGHEELDTSKQQQRIYKTSEGSMLAAWSICD